MLLLFLCLFSPLERLTNGWNYENYSIFTFPLNPPLIKWDLSLRSIKGCCYVIVIPLSLFFVGTPYEWVEH